MGAGGRLALCLDCGAAQKPADAQWREEAKTIYRDYALFNEPNQFEQMIFTESGVAVRRSVKVLNYLLDQWQAPDQGRFLDVGSGNGAALDAFSSLKKSWQLNALDIDNKGLAALSAIPGFAELYTGDISAAQGKFDLVTAIHCLEHLEKPYEMLAGIRERLNPDGRLVIQVPDHISNPFDLLIADHRSHFSPQILAGILEASDFDVIIASDDLLPKEISIIARTGTGKKQAPKTIDVAKAEAAIESRVSWLRRLLVSGLEAYNPDRPFGLFGTSIAATAFASPMIDRVAFFVDEDEQMIGKDWLDRPVLSPDDVPENAIVFAPMAPLIAQRLADRFRDAPFEVLIPPRLD